MGPLLQFRNCYLLRNHELVKDDLSVRDGIIQNPEKIFFDENLPADIQIDCNGSIIAPGLIDVQINGAMGCDFSLLSDDYDAGLTMAAKELLSHGVTSFCPTVITSPADVYKKLLPHIKRSNGSRDGAGILGVHIEGPFISKEKNGAHPTEHIRSIKSGINDFLDIYGSLDNVSILTLAPEIDNALEVTEELVKRGIVVSLGHSTADLLRGEAAARKGATFITHLFNAMLPFHHRDPHLVGLLATDQLPENHKIYYGIIPDGIHTHPAALRIAYRTHPKGVVLVTDACPIMGLPPGNIHHMGELKTEIKHGAAFIAGTQTLCGSIAHLNTCVQNFQKATGCSKEEALEAASLHPAQLLKIADKKGTLEFGTDADFILLDDDLYLNATYIAGEKVWENEKTSKILNVIEAN